jgi:hypothetical protein
MITNLRSSSFKNYCLGYRVSRKKQLEMDLKCEEKPITFTKFIDWGNAHEVNGLAKWVTLNKQMPKHILEDQKSFQVEDWYKNFSISTTPDGVLEETLLEIKCPAAGVKNYPEVDKKGNKLPYDGFPAEHLCQVYGQQMIMNKLGYKIKKTDLVSWTPKHTKIWTVWLNEDYILYMSELLKEYCKSLLTKDKLDKPDPYQGKHYIELTYNNGA